MGRGCKKYWKMDKNLLFFVLVSQEMDLWKIIISINCSMALILFHDIHVEIGTTFCESIKSFWSYFEKVGPKSVPK